MKRASKEASVRARYGLIASNLDERCRRLWAAAEAQAAGYGGVSLVARATGLSRPLIHRGLSELPSGVSPGPGRVRRKGAGPPRLETCQPGLKAALDALAEPTSRGDPESPLRWTCKGVRRLAAALKKQGYRVGRQKVSELLGELGYSLQGNRKTQEGGTHPDRDAQFRHIARRTKAHLKIGDPVISVDTKKKELVGKYKNGGREWHRQKQPTEVKVHDFVDKDLGRAIPYGVFDLAANAGWVGVGCDHDTAEFAVATIRSWWRHMGRKRYPNAKRLLITADGGGSNSSRSRTWLEGGVAGVGRRTGDGDIGLPLSAGHEQVEQDRTPALQPDRDQLAWPAVDEPRGDRQADREYDECIRPAGSSPSGQKEVRGWQKDRGGAVAEDPHPPRPLPRRMELHHPAENGTGEVVTLINGRLLRVRFKISGA
jgi:hypothetical protein